MSKCHLKQTKNKENIYEGINLKRGLLIFFQNKFETNYHSFTPDTQRAFVVLKCAPPMTQKFTQFDSIWFTNEENIGKCFDDKYMFDDERFYLAKL